MSKQNAQKGSVIFYILIAIVLFAALGFAVSNMMRGAPAEIGKEKAQLYADEILDYARAIRGAVQTLRISNSCAETDISFVNGTVSGYTHSPVVDDECKIFHADGAGMGWVTPLAAVNGGLDWIYTGHNSVPDVGTDAASDLVMILPDIKKSVCLSTNEKLGIAEVGGDAPLDADNIDATKFTGSYSATAQIGLAASFESKMNGCFKNTAPNPDTYNFYQVLIAR